MTRLIVHADHGAFTVVRVVRPRLKAKYYAWRCNLCPADSIAAPMLASHQVESAGNRHVATHELPEEPCS